MTVPLGETCRVVIGPLTLFARRTPGLWELAATQDRDPFVDTVTGPEPVDADPAEVPGYRRIACEGDAAEITLTPRTADRPVISRPEHPFVLPRRQSVVVYLSTPVWLSASAGGTELVEIPCYRPSDTWFGPSPREGELCYASRAFYRTHLDAAQRLPHRLYTEVEIRNEAGDALQLERLNLPAPYFSVFAAADASLWTERLCYVREGDGDMAPARIDPTPPKTLGETTPVSSPRQRHQEALWVRAFSSLVDTGWLRW